MYLHVNDVFFAFFDILDMLSQLLQIYEQDFLSLMIEEHRFQIFKSTKMWRV